MLNTTTARRGIAVASLAQMKAEIEERDQRDKTRADSPLVQAEDAVYVDSSALSIAEVVAKLMRLVSQKVAS